MCTLQQQHKLSFVGFNSALWSAAIWRECFISAKEILISVREKWLTKPLVSSGRRCAAVAEQADGHDEQPLLLDFSAVRRCFHRSQWCPGCASTKVFDFWVGSWLVLVLVLVICKLEAGSGDDGGDFYPTPDSVKWPEGQSASLQYLIPNYYCFQSRQ